MATQWLLTFFYPIWNPTNVTSSFHATNLLRHYVRPIDFCVDRLYLLFLNTDHSTVFNQLFVTTKEYELETHHTLLSLRVPPHIPRAKETLPRTFTIQSAHNLCAQGISKISATPVGSMHTGQCMNSTDSLWNRRTASCIQSRAVGWAFSTARARISACVVEVSPRFVWCDLLGE